MISLSASFRLKKKKILNINFFSNCKIAKIWHEMKSIVAALLSLFTMIFEKVSIFILSFFKYPVKSWRIWGNMPLLDYQSKILFISALKWREELKHSCFKFTCHYDAFFGQMLRFSFFFFLTWTHIPIYLEKNVCH